MQDKHIKIKNIQFFLVCLFFASLNFEMFSPIIENFSVAKMTAYLYIAVMLLQPRHLFSTKNISRPLGYAFTMFFLMVISSIVHIHENTTIFDTSIFFNIIMFWILLNHSRRDERVFQEGLLWFSMTSFLIGVFYFFGIGVTVSQDLRIVVFGENANTLGLKMGVGALFLMNYCLSHSSEKLIYRPWLLVLVLPMLLLLFATASRVALLVLVSGVVLFILFRTNTRKKGQKIIWILLGVIILYVGYRYLLQQEVLISRMDDSIENRNLAGRDYIWQTYMKVIYQNPILGVGFTGADRYSISIFGVVRSPHNVLIEVALYSGILGLIWFIAFLIDYYKCAWQYRKRLNYLGPLMTSMASVGMVLSGQALDVKLFWVLAAYAISYRIFASKQRQER